MLLGRYIDHLPPSYSRRVDAVQVGRGGPEVGVPTGAGVRPRRSRDREQLDVKAIASPCSGPAEPWQRASAASGGVALRCRPREAFYKSADESCSEQPERLSLMNSTCDETGRCLRHSRWCG
jgi:hypothetical protein